jgi:hypothetical protein
VDRDFFLLENPLPISLDLCPCLHLHADAVRCARLLRRRFPDMENRAYVALFVFHPVSPPATVGPPLTPVSSEQTSEPNLLSHRATGRASPTPERGSTGHCEWKGRARRHVVRLSRPRKSRVGSSRAGCGCELGLGGRPFHPRIFSGSTVPAVRRGKNRMWLRARPHEQICGRCVFLINFVPKNERRTGN